MDSDSVMRLESFRAINSSGMTVFLSLKLFDFESFRLTICLIFSSKNSCTDHEHGELMPKNESKMANLNLKKLVLGLSYLFDK